MSLMGVKMSSWSLVLYPPSGLHDNDNDNNALIMRHLSRQAYSEAQKHET